MAAASNPEGTALQDEAPHPVLTDVSEALHLISSAAVFLSPDEQPGGRPAPDLDARQAAELLEQLARVTLQTRRCLDGIREGHGVRYMPLKGIDAVAGMLGSAGAFLIGTAADAARAAARMPARQRPAQPASPTAAGLAFPRGAAPAGAAPGGRRAARPATTLIARGQTT